MEGTIKICDECKKEARYITGQIGGYPPSFDWIIVTRCSSKSGDKVGAGIHHFCCDKCLIGYINNRNTVPTISTYDKDRDNPYPL